MWGKVDCWFVWKWTLWREFEVGSIAIFLGGLGLLLVLSGLSFVGRGSPRLRIFGGGWDRSSLESSELELVPVEVLLSFGPVVAMDDVFKMFLRVLDWAFVPNWSEDGGTWIWWPRQVVWGWVVGRGMDGSIAGWIFIGSGRIGHGEWRWSFAWLGWGGGVRCE